MLVMLFALGAVGCGDPLASADFHSRPLFSVTGRMNRVGVGVPLPGLVWVDLTGQSGFAAASPGTAQSRLTGPDSFVIDVFAPPPPDLVTAFRNSSGDVRAAIAFAEIVVADDVDADGRFGLEPSGGGHTRAAAPDAFLGAAAKHAMVYVEVPPPTDGSEDLGLFANAEALLPGFHLIRADCREPLHPERGNFIVVPKTEPITLEIGVGTSDLPVLRQCLDSRRR